MQLEQQLGTYSRIGTAPWILSFNVLLYLLIGFPSGSVLKNPPANAGDPGDEVQFLGGEDPLEEEMATHPNILGWKIPWTEKSGGLQFMGLQRVRQNLETEHAHIY